MNIIELYFFFGFSTPARCTSKFVSLAHTSWLTQNSAVIAVTAALKIYHMYI